jgi:hypothetical protein
VQVGPTMASKYGVLIANGKFSDEKIQRLAASFEDVDALRDVMINPAIGGFPPSNIDVLLDKSLEAVREAVALLFRDKQGDDLILLYYTGHGFQDENGDLYFALEGTKVSNPSAGSLEADFVRRQMDRCASSRQVVILDCCHSGAFARK